MRYGSCRRFFRIFLRTYSTVYTDPNHTFFAIQVQILAPCFWKTIAMKKFYTKFKHLKKLYCKVTEVHKKVEKRCKKSLQNSVSLSVLKCWLLGAQIHFPRYLVRLCFLYPEPGSQPEYGFRNALERISNTDPDSKHWPQHKFPVVIFTLFLSHLNQWRCGN